MTTPLRVNGLTGIGTIDLGGVGVVDVTVPLSPAGDNSATSRQYVLAIAQGLDPKESCRVATAAPLPTYTRLVNVITLGSNVCINTAGVDGKTDLALGQSILLKNGAAGADNGIYTITTLGVEGASPTVLTRRSDFINPEVTTGAFTWIEEGTANKEKQFTLITTGTININVTSLVFSVTGGVGAYSEGNGIDISSNVISVVPSEIAGTGLESDGGSPLKLRLAAPGTGLTGGGGSALAVALAPGNNGLEFNSSALRVKIDEGTAGYSDTIVRGANGLYVDMQRGQESFSGVDNKFISFTTPWADSNYTVVITASDNLNGWCTSTVSTGFRANLSDALAGAVNWVAIHNVTT